MATKSRMKRRAFRNPKRARGGGSNWFNVSVAAVVVIGVTLVLISRSPNSAGSVGPKLKNSDGVVDHWHAALGVNVCGKWEATPVWPVSSSTQSLGRAGNTSIYAGLHTHVLADGTGDGIIHMEPAASDESGRNATVGRFMKFGGWKLNSTSMKLWPGFDGKPIEKKNGDKCGDKKGELRWAVGLKKAGEEKVKLTEQKGNPANFKLYDQSVVAIYFVSADEKLDKLGEVPSIPNLNGATERGEGAMATTTTAAGSTTTVAGGTTTTGAGATTTTGAGATTTTGAPTSTTTK